MKEKDEEYAGVKKAFMSALEGMRRYQDGIDEIIKSGPVAEMFVSRCAGCYLEEELGHRDNGTTLTHCCHPDAPVEEGADETPFDGSMAKWCPLKKRPLLMQAEAREL